MTTRDQIIETADRLFYHGGFEATSFADIAEAVGISRGNFYHHFKTKDAILEAVVTLRLARTRAMLEAWHTEAPDPRGRIRAFIHMLIANRAQIMAHGCPVGTLCLELAKLDHAAQHRAAEIFGLYRDWLAGQFHALGHGARAEALALHLLGWSQGTAVLIAALRDEAFLQREVAGIEAWLEGLPLSPNTPHKDPACSSPS
ncbi:MAG: TetR/AcrR family transcriptional regulator [Sphingomonadales bacterium]|nr:TetR/AcrR family transcriptional regulator [Sphingomonadales bacterium]